MTVKVQSGSSVWGLLHIVAVCVLWLTCSTAIVLANRTIIMGGFPYPLALSSLGQVVAFVASGLITFRSTLHAQHQAQQVQQSDPERHPLLPTQNTANSTSKQHQPQPSSPSAATELSPSPRNDSEKPFFMTWPFFWSRVAPIGVAQGLGIWCANQLYLLLTVAFIEMAKALLPVCIMTALWAMGLETPSKAQIAAVVLAAVGCAISAYGEAHLVILGVLVLGLSFATEIARMLLLQYLTQRCQLGPWQTMFYVTGPSAVCLTTLMFVLEWSTMVEDGAGSAVVSQWPLFLVASSLGTAGLYVTTLVIQLSSATTVKLLAAVRGPIIVLSGVLLFSEKVSLLQLIGYTVALVGFVWYSVAPKASSTSAAAAPVGSPSVLPIMGPASNHQLLIPARQDSGPCQELHSLASSKP